MRWTAARLAEIASMAEAGCDKAEIAKAFGVSPCAIYFQARRHGYRLVPLKNPGRPGPTPSTLDAKLRRRWAKRLPAMKAALKDALQ